MKKFFKWIRRDERGQSATEYMLIIGVIVISLVIAAKAFVPKFEEAVTTISEGVKSCVATGECNFAK